MISKFHLVGSLNNIALVDSEPTKGRRPNITVIDVKYDRESVNKLVLVIAKPEPKIIVKSKKIKLFHNHPHFL